MHTQKYVGTYCICLSNYITPNTRPLFPPRPARPLRERLGLTPPPLIPLIVDPATRTGDDNELATTATPTIQRHIRRAQRRDGTPSTSSGASREEDGVATSPDGGDTSSPIKLSLIFLISSQ